MEPTTDTLRYRACPLCEAICGLEFRFRGDTLRAIHGDPEDPFSRGHICPKGNAILDLEADPDRLQQPMRRVGADWQPVSWEFAFAEIGRELHAIQSESGRDAVAMYFGNPNVHHFGLGAYVPFLARAVGTRNLYSASSVDQWPHQLVCWQMYGHQWLLPIPDLDQLDTFVMLGANPLASNGSLMTAADVTERLKAIAKRGHLIVVDPRRTETAAIASQHLPIRPASDFCFLLALLTELRRIGPPRLAVYANQLRGFERVLDLIDTLDTDALLAPTGIARADARAVAETLYSATNAAVYGRMGVSTQRFGTVSQYLIQLINLYLGQLDRAGGVLPNEPAFPITGPGTSRGSRGRWQSRVRGLPEVSGELPVAALREEIETPGVGQIRALISVAGNPALSTPDGARLGQAISQLALYVAVDPYLNETTRHAHWILPPPSHLGEDHYDLFFNAFAIRRIARLSQPILPLPAGALPQWQILQGLTHGLQAARGEPHQPWPDPRTVLAQGLAKGSSGLTVADLVLSEHGIDLGPLQPSLLRRLQTESGAIEAAPDFLWQLLQDAVQAWLRGGLAAPTDALQLIGRRHVRSNNSWMHNSERLVKGKPRHQLLMHPEDAASRGIVDGATVQIRSRVGTVQTEVVLSADVRPGVVSLPHGFGHQQDGVRLHRAAHVNGVSCNDLTDPEHLDGGTGNAALNGTPVWVTCADQSA
ncbi:dehydrogenase [Ahniella affigens]|uniref:Dehydrogenase n=2 Tax=Ahniella affigens TaxID=2021234 RepID=A0A2P1PYS4_9GAMM|nr:dehydrogenase [Ahniella affigens]